MITTTDPIYFGGVSILTVPGWMTTGTDTFPYPSRDVRNSHIANSNLSVTTSAFFTGRKLGVRGVIARSRREELDSSISELRRILKSKNQTLQLPVFGEQRQFYQVTVSNIAFKDVRGGYAEIDIELTATDPYSYKLTSVQPLDLVNVTVPTKSTQITFNGTASQVPIITYAIDSLTGGTNKTVTIQNEATGVSISVQRTWSASDVMVINSYAKTLTVNGTDTEFTGNFPEWDSGLGGILYTDTFSTRQVDLRVAYTQRDS